ncbi:hypothetical protein BS35_008119 [Actinomadura glauciflava]|nr:hypothetical protein [Actinomadura glauciflava]
MRLNPGPWNAPSSAVTANLHRLWSYGLGAGTPPALLPFAADACAFAALGGQHTGWRALVLRQRRQACNPRPGRCGWNGWSCFTDPAVFLTKGRHRLRQPQFGDPLRIAGHGARTLPAIDLGLPDPGPQCLTMHPELVGDTSNRAGLLTCLFTPLEDHPDRAFAQFSGVVPWGCHCPSPFQASGPPSHPLNRTGLPGPCPPGCTGIAGHRHLGHGAHRRRGGHHEARRTLQTCNCRPGKRPSRPGPTLSAAALPMTIIASSVKRQHLKRLRARER